MWRLCGVALCSCVFYSVPFYFARVLNDMWGEQFFVQGDFTNDCAGKPMVLTMGYNLYLAAIARSPRT